MAPRGAVKKRPAAACVDEAEEDFNDECMDTPDPPTPAAKRGRGRHPGRGATSPTNVDRHELLKGSPISVHSEKGCRIGFHEPVAHKDSPGTAAARVMQVSTGGAAAPEKRWASPLKQPPKDRLRVSYAPPEAGVAPSLCSGLVALRNGGNLCDAAVLAGGGQRLPVHRLVLAANSDALSSRLQGETGELDLKAYSHEAVELLVRWLYGEVHIGSYAPSSEQVNEEVLRFSSEFRLPPLAELCALHLAKNVEVKNVVARIRLCEEFGLPRLRSTLVGALCEDRHMLDAVARDASTLCHPALMRELLASIARQAHCHD
mmetsp:Transcript_15849/g.50725  ORF Transcript_15849/g.50725 Transcript_15849/m.50725 type:complete len:317 (-) Transcript_15849:183-1133(-)